MRRPDGRQALGGRAHPRRQRVQPLEREPIRRARQRHRAHHCPLARDRRGDGPAALGQLLVGDRIARRADALELRPEGRHGGDGLGRHRRESAAEHARHLLGSQRRQPQLARGRRVKRRPEPDQRQEPDGLAAALGLAHEEHLVAVDHRELDQLVGLVRQLLEHGQKDARHAGLIGMAEGQGEQAPRQEEAAAAGVPAHVVALLQRVQHLRDGPLPAANGPAQVPHGDAVGRGGQ